MRYYDLFRLFDRGVRIRWIKELDKVKFDRMININWGIIIDCGSIVWSYKLVGQGFELVVSESIS